MKLIFSIFVVFIIAFVVSDPLPNDSYENDGDSDIEVDYDIYENDSEKSNERSYIQKVQSFLSNMKDNVGNSKFVHRCIKFNYTLEPETNNDHRSAENQTINIQVPTDEQKESCWKYLKNRGAKARKWFTSWFSTTEDEQKTNEMITFSTTSKPTYDEDKIYFPGTYSTPKPPGFFEKLLG